jgi:ribonuclease R
MARTHEEPDIKRLENTIEVLKMAGYRIKINKEEDLDMQIPAILNSLRSYEEFPILSNMILKCMARASYTTNTIGHYGLKLERYMHFTSPIRRFPDLETHFLLKMYHSKNLEDIDLDLLAIHLKQDAEYSSKRERMADCAEEEAIALKNTEYYENMIGTEVVGHISGITYKRILVQTNDLVNGIVKIDDIKTSNLGVHGNRSLDYRLQHDNLKIGSKVLLEIKEIDKDEKVVHFILKKNLSWKKDKEMTLTRELKY